MRFQETYLWSYFMRERQYTRKRKKRARTSENVTFGNTISSGYAKPQDDQELTDGEMTP